MIQAFRRSTVI